MNRRTIIGSLIAVVTVVTSVIVLLWTEKPRRFLQARVEQVRSALPGPEQVRQSARQVTTRVSQLASGVKGTTRQTMSKVKQTGSDVAEKAKQLTTVGN